MLPVLLLPQPPTRPSPASAIFYHFSLSCLQVNQNYPDCQDKDGMCESWAGSGECEVGALHCQDFSKLVRLGGMLGLASRWRAMGGGCMRRSFRLGAAVAAVAAVAAGGCGGHGPPCRQHLRLGLLVAG